MSEHMEFYIDRYSFDLQTKSYGLTVIKQNCDIHEYKNCHHVIKISAVEALQAKLDLAVTAMAKEINKFDMELYSPHTQDFRDYYSGQKSRLLEALDKIKGKT